MTLSPWLPWFYQYGVGGLMAAGTILLAWRAGALSLSRPGDRRLLAALAAGYLSFAVLHAVWIFVVSGS